MRISMLTILLLSTLSWAQASQPTWQQQPGGQLILKSFAHAPYPHASRENGWHYQDAFFPKAGHYDDSTVGIFIPSAFQPGSKVDFVVHFHGWGNHVSNVISQYQLTQQLNFARVNAILIVPQGPKDASDSGGGKLELDPQAFEQLILEVAHFLRAENKTATEEIGDITLSTHSGGYKVTAAILDHGGMAEHIHDVLLLDSSYGSLPQFVKWVKASPQHRLVSTYTDHLEKTNLEFIDLLKAANVAVRRLDENSLTDTDMEKRGATFFHTVGPHNQVPITYFGRFLATSMMSKLPPGKPLQ